MILNNLDETAVLNDEIDRATNRKREIDEAYKTIRTNACQFAAYLNKHCILPYNIHKKEYLEKQIKLEVGQKDNSIYL